VWLQPVVGFDILGLDCSSPGVAGESGGDGGDIVRVRLELRRECNPCVHRDAVPVADVQTRDAVDRRDGQRKVLRGWRRRRAEVGDHQRLPAVGLGTLGREDSPLCPLALDMTRQRLGGSGTHTQVPRVAPDNLVNRREG